MLSSAILFWNREKKMSNKQWQYEMSLWKLIYTKQIPRSKSLARKLIANRKVTVNDFRVFWNDAYMPCGAYRIYLWRKCAIRSARRPRSVVRAIYMWHAEILGLLSYLTYVRKDIIDVNLSDLLSTFLSVKRCANSTIGSNVNTLASTFFQQWTLPRWDMTFHRITHVIVSWQGGGATRAQTLRAYHIMMTRSAVR